jgi:hypothetical protein
MAMKRPSNRLTSRAHRKIAETSSHFPAAFQMPGRRGGTRPQQTQERLQREPGPRRDDGHRHLLADAEHSLAHEQSGIRLRAVGKEAAQHYQVRFPGRVVGRSFGAFRRRLTILVRDRRRRPVGSGSDRREGRMGVERGGSGGSHVQAQGRLRAKSTVLGVATCPARRTGGSRRARFTASLGSNPRCSVSMRSKRSRQSKPRRSSSAASE